VLKFAAAGQRRSTEAMQWRVRMANRELGLSVERGSERPTSGGGHGLDSNSSLTSGPSEEWNGKREIASGPTRQRSASLRLARRRHGRLVPRPLRRGRPTRAPARPLLRAVRRGRSGTVRGLGARHAPALREILERRWQLAVLLGLVFAAISAFIAISAEDSTTHPGGIEFLAALGWRGVVYGAADGLLLSAFPILLVFAALHDSRLRRRTGGLVAVGAVAMVASLAMTAVYHAGYSDFHSDKLRKPVTGDLVWSAPTLATLNPIGAPIAHVGLHAGAVVHNYDTDLFLSPH
jgi:hypothetical protein